MSVIQLDFLRWDLSHVHISHHALDRFKTRFKRQNNKRPNNAKKLLRSYLGSARFFGISKRRKRIRMIFVNGAWVFVFDRRLSTLIIQGNTRYFYNRGLLIQSNPLTF